MFSRKPAIDPIDPIDQATVDDHRSVRYMSQLMINCFLNGPTPASFYLFSSFQIHITNFTTNRYVKNVHPV